MIRPKFPATSSLIAAFSALSTLAAVAADYSVNPSTTGSSANDKLWSQTSTWLVGGETPASIPSHAEDHVTYGPSSGVRINLIADVSEIRLASMEINGATGLSRGIFAADGVTSMLTIDDFSYTRSDSGSNTLWIRNDSATGTLGFSIGNLTVGAGTTLELGHEDNRAGYSIDSFTVSGNSTIAGDVRFSSIAQRGEVGENLLVLGDLNLTGQLTLGGRGNAGSTVQVRSLTGNGNLHVYRNHTHPGTSGTLVINATQSGSASYEGTVRDFYSATIPQGVEAVLSVKKSGVGTQIFSAASGNFYSGGTVIEGGVLAVDNTSGSGLGTGHVAVQSSGTLAGQGRIALKDQTITLKAGGTLAPSAHLGSGFATLTISGADSPNAALLSLEQGSTLFFRLGSSHTSDQIAFTNWHSGGLQLAEEGVIINASNVAAGRYDLFSFDSIETSELSSLTNALNAQTLGSGFDGWNGVFGHEVKGDGSVIWLEVIAIPEPASTLSTIFGLGLLHWTMRRRKVAG